MKRTKYILLALVISTSIAFSQTKEKAADFSLKTADGKTVELSKLKGKPVVVNFWATWCPPCRKEIPGFIEIYNKYKSKGLEVVGISLDEKGWSVITPFVKKEKIPYPVVLDDGGKIAKKYGEIRSIPTTFFVDKKGNIAKSHVGYMAKDDFEKAVKALL